MITVNNLKFTYRGNQEPTVKGIDFSIGKGEIFGFLGPSGAGKSTTQKVLIKLLSGYQGDISVMDKPLHAWKNNYYEHIGVGFELPNHYQKLSARENLRFFGSFYKRPLLDSLKLLERVGLGKDADKKVSDYSKGMKMRLNFVRALQHDPDIIFFDEPTSGLDPANGRILKDIILEERDRGKTVFLTTHKMNDADELCDRVAFIVDGSIRLIDSPEELRLQHGKRVVQVKKGEHSEEILEFPLDGIAENSAFHESLKGGNIRSIHTLEASLEDIFIKVTGRVLQ